MSEQEMLLRDLLVSEQVGNQLTLDSQNFINIKSQHYTAIWNTIDHSSLHEDIELISRYLFHKNICTIHICQIGIFSSRELKSTTITVHREVLELEANEDFLITCEALSGTHISNFHNLVGQKITMGTLIINNNIVLEEALLNKTFMNEEIRPIRREEIHLMNFVIFGKHLHCLKKAI